VIKTDGKTKLPVLLIGYSRESGIQNLLGSINPVEVASIHLALDGFKSWEVEVAQRAIIQHVSSYCSKNGIPLRTWMRNENLGVAVSIITAVDWFFAEVDHGVVLEDDLLLGRDFFKFVRHGLQCLAGNPDVLLVSGDCYLTETTTDTSGFLANYPLIWGWASTSNNWAQIRAGILADRSLSTLLGFNRRKNYWRVGAIRVLRGQVDTWDIPFADFMISHNKLCLFSSKNLITNNGNDSFASHTLNQQFPLNLPVSPWNSNLEFNLEKSLSGRAANNSQLDKTVFKIRMRHSILGITYLIRLLFGLEKSNLEPLASRVQRISLPETS
jgi:hypothetical protein